MRTYLAVAPLWVVATVSGLIMATTWTAFMAIEDHRLRLSLIVIGVGVGAFFGLATGRQTRRERLRTSGITGGLTVEQRRAVIAAADTGTPPQDSALHRAAAALARDALDQELRTHSKTIVVLTALLALSVGLAVFDSWWYLALTPVFAGAVIRGVRSPARLRRHISSLEATVGEKDVRPAEPR